MDWIWIIIGLAAVCVFTCIVVAVSALMNSPRTDGIKERRPGYQDVLVKGGVDVKALKYIHDVAPFPNRDGIEAFPTLMTEDRLQRYQIVLTDVNTGKKHICSFDEQLVIGRDPAAKRNESRFIVIDSGVSKTHCRITNRGNILELADLQSRNGTYINGKLLSGTGLLHSGDRITIGNTTFSIEISKG